MGVESLGTASPAASRAGLRPGRRIRSLRLGGLAVAVGVVLADSSVVVLALPNVLGTFSTSIARVAWVLVAFNLVLAVAAVPTAWLSRRVGARSVMVAGLLVLGISTAACAAAVSIDQLIAARCAQAIGAAAVVGAALELLTEVGGNEHRAVRTWTAAGAAGAALGPAVGGVITQLFSWRAVFVIQVPVIVVLLAIVWGIRATAPLRTPVDRPRLAVNAALGLLSAALTAALFLLVLMLVDGWRMTPVAAALTVSVMPAVAIGAGRFVTLVELLRVRAATGGVLLGGGLAALGELARGTPVWTIAPQVAIGLGLALALSSLTEVALEDRSPAAMHGAWTIAMRHAGVVLGILVLTPVFTSDLTKQTATAQAAGAAIVLNANLPLLPKLALGAALERQVQRTPDYVPDLTPAFRAQHPSPGRRPAYRQVEAALAGQIRRAGAAAFSRAFQIAALIALAALVPLAVARRLRSAAG
ncbi:MAG: MFS transporter [Gaiellales bacterium]